MTRDDEPPVPSLDAHTRHARDCLHAAHLALDDALDALGAVLDGLDGHPMDARRPHDTPDAPRPRDAGTPRRLAVTDTGCRCRTYPIAAVRVERLPDGRQRLILPDGGTR